MPLVADLNNELILLFEEVCEDLTPFDRVAVVSMALTAYLSQCLEKASP